MKPKDVISIFNILEFSSDHNPILLEEDEQNESWWEENKCDIYSYSLGSIAVIFGLIPWLVGLVMLVKWLFF